MEIKSYTQFLNEDFDSESLESEVSSSSEQYQEIRDDISEMIEKSLKTSDSKTMKDFISAYIRNPDDSSIEGLVNDSDVYEFYLKYRNDIDELLSNIKFYDEIPSEMNSYSLYDYVIKGTKRSISELMNDIIEKSN